MWVFALVVLALAKNCTVIDPQNCLCSDYANIEVCEAAFDFQPSQNCVFDLKSNKCTDGLFTVVADDRAGIGKRRCEAVWHVKI